MAKKGMDTQKRAKGKDGWGACKFCGTAPPEPKMVIENGKTSMRRTCCEKKNKKKPS